MSEMILVTGGAGFIGSNIVLSLLSQGKSVVVLDNLSSGYRENLCSDAEFIQGDIRDAETVFRAASKCDGIIHLAASVGNKRSIDNPGSDAESNLIGTIHVLEAARRERIRRIVLSSSAGIFGELKTLPISEDHPQDPDSPYGVSKLAAEKMCLVYNRLYGMENVCLRYFNVYGPHQRFDAYGNVIPIFAAGILKREPLTIFGDGEQTRDFVNVHDVVAANIAAATASGAHGVFNIGSGTSVTINELAGMMIGLSGREVAVNHASPRKGDVRDSLADIRKARSVLGFEPEVFLREGLAEYWDWFVRDGVGPLT
jgi:UDP-glucose 4-epimerase